jgi:hypothetical protein
MLWKFKQVYNTHRQFADHQRPVTYAMRPPAAVASRPRARDLFVHIPSPARAETTASSRA